MTAIRLQTVLGEAIERTQNLGDDAGERKTEIETLETLAKICKQHINNNLVILQAAKMLKDADAKARAIQSVLGEGNDNSPGSSTESSGSDSETSNSSSESSGSEDN